MNSIVWLIRLRISNICLMMQSIVMRIMRQQEWPDVGLIRKKRRELGITQQELARVSGVPQPVVSRIENGSISEPSYHVVQKIFEALHEIEAQSGGKRGTVDSLPVASDLMNKHVVSVKPTDRVEDAWAIMKKNGFSQLPVTDERGRVYGGIAESSLPSEDMENILEKRVQEVMGDAFPAVGRDTKVATLVALLRGEPAVLMLDKGRLAGIITPYDLMENAYKKNPHLTK